jgi:hypothetical protein
MMQTTTKVATTVRMPDDLHYLARIEAAKARLTLSDYIVTVLQKAVPQQKKLAK